MNIHRHRGPICVLLSLALSASAQDYLISLERGTAYIGSSTGEKVCMLVLPDGRYRVEKGSWTKDAKHARVFRAALPEQSLNTLQNLINDSELKKISSPSTEIKQMTISHDAVVFLFKISRNGETQYGHFFKADGGKSFPEPVKALMKWFIDNTKTKLPQDKSVNPNQCSQLD